MKQSGCFSSTFSFLVGIFLVLEGIWGLFDDMFLWLFSTNKLHSCIHLLLGFLGIWMCFRQKSVAFCTILGWILLIAGVARFIPLFDFITIDMLNMNYNMAYMDLAVSACCFFCAFMGKD